MNQEYREQLRWAAGVVFGIACALPVENNEEVKSALGSMARTINKILMEIEDEDGGESDEQRD